MSYENVIILLLAILLDLVVSEPPSIIHPTVWTGKIIAILEKFGLEIRSKIWQFVFGALGSLFLILGLGYLSFLILAYASGFGILVYVVLGSVLLKPAFCLRYSCRLSLLVKIFLENGQVNNPSSAAVDIRYLLSTVEIKGGEEIRPAIISSTIRSLVENASDFFVAPLFYFLILGVPGAIAYRVANTLDGMIGHRGKYEYLGKFAARFDDILNFIPSRLTGLLFVLGSWILGYNTRQSWKIMLRDHSNTESPNAGWPMSATAGALNARLDRSGYYSLGDAINPLTSETILHSVKLFRTVAAFDILASASVIYLLYLLL
ncbi:adenosylcobinamide-phosphate synthase CbiB [Dehalogenimonas etheniformans]|uniref:Cobalamin biosynthesis protein CobD n=1 Tax=Dehalogenimonas etheniformans TaxID=1536648 RepID=A0A2P5PA80_9CHLR|nr:adenosylcobinamide-phosphate synthase CbiB [Dehalogenimonas etheniformans]PPD59187.1 cobalamin biosynthesis protein CobD [Dehalogenimonas etheniformans]QNT75770.1 cobalamin biosynthesis protein CobD [Dehalogenimonas etheniformans]